MINNSSEEVYPIECGFPASYWRTAKSIHLTGYEIATPLFAVICLPGYLFTLIALTKQTGSEKAYFYQLFLMASKSLEVLALMFFSYSFSWGGVETGGLQWYKNSYVLMWYTAHVGIPSTQLTMNTSMYIALSMAIDRLFALIKPLQYKATNRRRHLGLALIASILIGLTSSLYNCFLFNVSPSDGGGYRVVADQDFEDSAIGCFMTVVANFIRIFGLILLIFANVALVRTFRLRLRKVATLVAVSLNNKEQSRIAKERTLILLTVCQSSFCFFIQLSEVVFYSFAYTIPNFYCYSRLLSPVLNMDLELFAIADVVAPFFISKPLRLTALKLVRHTIRSVQSNSDQKRNR